MAANLARALPLQRLCRRHDLKLKTVGQPEQMLGGDSCTVHRCGKGCRSCSTDFRHFNLLILLFLD